MIIPINIPDTLPEGHGASFKKGLADALLEAAMTPLEHTPSGHELSRKRGEEVGQLLAKEIANIVKKPQP